MRAFVFFLFYVFLCNGYALADDNPAKAPAGTGHSSPGGSGEPKCCSNDFVNKLFTKAKRGGSGDPVCCTQDDIIHILEAQKNGLIEQQQKGDQANKNSLAEQRQKVDQAIQALKDSKK